jgi:hypothetical protein
MPTNTKSPLSPIKRVKSKDLTQEMRWLREHRREHAGQWVAIEGDRLVAHDLDADKFFAEVEQSGVKDPLFAHLEPEDERPFAGAWL